jgi:hypothetical protein
MIAIVLDERERCDCFPALFALWMWSRLLAWLTAVLYVCISLFGSL